MSYANKKDDYPESVKDMGDVMIQVKVSPRKKSAEKKANWNPNRKVPM